MFAIRYHRRIVDDISSLPRDTKDRIQKAIEEKLSTQPELFGKPLRYTLIGFRSLRVGDYRVIYLIESSKQVFILLIAHRSNVYKLISKRV
ncbi:MAG: type II toxin-antitoxin system RelE/ParE family toxin [Candidatus Colwellbacteria bacterium]